MNWDHLIGQQGAKEYLRAVLRSQRLAHAYLFKGPAGVGKRTAAHLFAQAILCHRPPAPDVACGACRSCAWMDSGAGVLSGHPDLIPLLKNVNSSRQDESVVGAQDLVIRMETIQYVCEQIHRAPSAGARRVAIIPEAQRLCGGQAEAANSFLKTLEEPPAAALLILTSSQPEKLLETILSRVQMVPFRRLAAEEIRTGLEYQPGLNDEALRLAVALSNGSLGHALELLSGDLKHWRQEVLKGLQQFSRTSWLGFGISLWTLAETEGKRLVAAEKSARKSRKAEEASEDEAERSGEESEGEIKDEAGWRRYVMRRLLEVCEVCFRDSLVCALKATPEEGLLLQPDQRALAQSLAQKFGAPGCERVLAALSEALLALRLYVRGDVVGRALAGRLREAMQHGAQ